MIGRRLQDLLTGIMGLKAEAMTAMVAKISVRASIVVFSTRSGYSIMTKYVNGEALLSQDGLIDVGPNNTDFYNGHCG